MESCESQSQYYPGAARFPQPSILLQMDHALKSSRLKMAAATPNSCRFSKTARWEWLSFSCIVLLSLCLLPSPSHSAPLQAGYVWNGDEQFANITGPTKYKRVSTTYLVSSPYDRTALALIIETSNTTAPVCYLEILYFFPPYNAYAPASPGDSPPSGSSTLPWTHPCPRTSLPNGNCSFAFTEDGDIRLMNSVADQTVVVWSSNTTGLGANGTLDMLDYYTPDDQGPFQGVLVVNNASSNIVWTNIRNDSGDFQCHIHEPVQTSQTPASQAAAGKKASVTSLIYLILVSLGARLVLWDSGTAADRPGRDQLLLFGFVVCCLLLPSTSQGKPIQAGFIANLTTDLVHYYPVLDNSTIWIGSSDFVVMSPANRTGLALTVLITNHWGPTCYLEVVRDAQTTDIMLDDSAPAPSGDLANTFQYVPWSAPCPRKLLPNGNCTFSFTKDGDIQVLNGVGGGYNVVWSSNTSGLGATTLDVLDSDPSASGSIVLYNAQNQVVWMNVRDMGTQDFQCGKPVAQKSLAAALHISIIASVPTLLLILLSTALLLS